MNKQDFAAWLRDLDTTGGAVIVFMGQAGFIIKDRQGLLYAVDVYFSDCCEAEFGADFARMIPKLLDPADVVFDYVLTTHGHHDHFDPDAMPTLMANGKTQLYVTASGREECRQLGLTERIHDLVIDTDYEIGNIHLRTVFCDHGEMMPDALGFLFTVDGKHILLCGDTASRPEKVAYLKDTPLDVMFVPINGAFGNLNEAEAIAYVDLLRPRLAVPCHYGNFKAHGGDVTLFNRLFDEKITGTKNAPLTIGDTITL